MNIETIIEVVRKWVEEETGPGFGYHINHCDDLTHYYNTLRDMLKNANKDELKERMSPGRSEEATENKNMGESGKPSFICHRIIRIDGTYDPTRMDLEQVLTYAPKIIVSDARAHMHTIENGIQITNVADCGESL